MSAEDSAGRMISSTRPPTPGGAFCAGLEEGCSLDIRDGFDVHTFLENICRALSAYCCVSGCSP